MRNDIESKLIYGLTGPRTLLHFHSNRIVSKLDSSHSSTSSLSPLSHFDESGSYHSKNFLWYTALDIEVFIIFSSVLISIFFATITIFGGGCRRVIWNSSLPVATLHFKWLLHCKEPYCVGERCHLSKMFFQFNQWPAKFHSFLSFLCDKKSLLFEVCHRVWFHSCV